MNRQRWRTALFLLLAAVAGLWLYQVASHGLAAARVVQSRLAWGRQIAAGASLPLLSPTELSSLEQDLAALDGHLRSLRSHTRPLLFMMARAGRSPVIGADVQALPHLLDLGIELIAAAREGAPLAAAFLAAEDREGETAGGATVQAALEALRANTALLEAAHRRIVAARAARARMRGRDFTTPLGRLVKMVDSYLPLLDSALLAAPAAPTILGGDRPRTYLVLAQNSDELRATGGFISSAGTMTVDGGRITQFELRDSYKADDIAIPHPVPPEPLIHYMRIGVLLLRDVNWWPDFPTSAALAMRLWQENQGQAVDGVIALDQQAVRLLLEAVGPLPVEGEAKPVAAADLTRILRESWGVVPEADEQKGQWWVGRKDFFSLLARAALNKLQSGLSAQETVRLARSLHRAVTGKHILVYSQEAALRPLLADLAVDGAILPTRGDYLMVVDTNMGFNKVNPRIEQRIEYTVNLAAAGRSQARLTAWYTNTASVRLTECVHGAVYGRTYEDMMERCYWDYLRVYAPLGSTALLGRDSPDMTVAQDGDKETFAAFFVVAPGATHALDVGYLLPPGIPQRQEQIDRYSLLVQKQPGTSSLPLSVAVELPAGARLMSAAPQPAHMSAAGLVFELALDRDLRIEVTYAH